MSKRRSRRAEPDDKYSEILEHVFELSDGGHKAATLFTEIPSASLYPDYRDIVQAPISLAEISKRTRLHTYETDEEFAADFEQMAINAALYNGDDSPVVDDALFMYDYVLESLGKPPSEANMRREQLRIVRELLEYKNRGHVPSQSFTGKKTPNFAQVQQQIEQEPFLDWDDFEAHVNEIFVSAMERNDESSGPYADAKTLQRSLHNRVIKAKKPRYSTPHLKFKSTRASSTPAEPDSDEEMLEPVPHRFDDDDDDDFEANEDDDEEDEEEEEEGYEEYDLEMPKPEFEIPQRQIIVRDEIIKRPPGATARDAMLQLVTCASILHHSVLHTMHYGARGDKPQIPPAYAKDMVQIRVSASKTDSFTSFAATLPSYHHTLTLTVYLHDRMRMLPHTLTLLLNGRKLQALPATGSDLREEFELRLSPGLNQVTVAVIGPDSAGTVRPFGPPPIVGAESDEERMILWLNLSR